MQSLSSTVLPLQAKTMFMTHTARRRIPIILCSINFLRRSWFLVFGLLRYCVHSYVFAIKKPPVLFRFPTLHFSCGLVTANGCITVNRLGSPPHLTPPFPFSLRRTKAISKTTDYPRWIITLEFACSVSNAAIRTA